MRPLLVLLLAAVLAAGCDRPGRPAAHPEGRAAGRFDILLPPARP